MIPIAESSRTRAAAILGIYAWLVKVVSALWLESYTEIRHSPWPSTPRWGRTPKGMILYVVYHDFKNFNSIGREGILGGKGLSI